jgi:hypothetical protein
MRNSPSGSLVSVVIVTRNRNKDLKECVSSYLKSTYKNLEIIIVDNASRPPVFTLFPKISKVKLVTSEFNLGAAGGRNKGLEVSRGDYILFTDDDAVADKEMISYLVDVFKTHSNTGLVQPLIYDKKNKKVLQGAGHDIDLTTGRIKAWGVREKDSGQYEGLREVPMCGCVWMVSKEVFKKIGNYDEDYFIPYEDSDFSIRARKAGFKLYCYSKAKSWHQGRKKTFINRRLEWLGITTKERVFRIARNKIIFMRKNSPFPNNFIFFFIFLPVYIILQSLIILTAGKMDIFIKYWMGLVSGLWYAISFPLSRRAGFYYRNFDQKLSGFKTVILSLTDPLTWILDTSSKSVLDLGCGQGGPMQFIKLILKIEKSVGVDLFKPYILENEKRRIHDRYLVEDIRKVKFKPESFDLVIASHVLEHMSKKDAWNVLGNMENIARKQIIVVAPIGDQYHSIEDGNILQLHKSAFAPQEFEKRGYKIKRYGFKWMLGENGMVHRIQNDLIRKLLYTLNILLTPVYYYFQSGCNYIFVAYKNK